MTKSKQIKSVFAFCGGLDSLTEMSLIRCLRLFYFGDLEMKTIKLTQNQTTIIDDEDFDRVKQHKWCALEQPKYKENKFMAVTNITHLDGRRETVYLHRFIMNAPKGLHVDHKDRNPLNNQKSNLRICTHAENQRNRAENSNNKSGFKGVCFVKHAKRYKAQIWANGKRTFLGYHDTAEAASEAYKQAANEIHGGYAKC